MAVTAAGTRSLVRADPPQAADTNTDARGGGRLGAELIAWRQALAAHWQEARFGAMSVQRHATERLVTIEVRLGGLDPEAVRVELYAEPIEGGEPERHVMERTRKLDERGHSYEYCASIPAVRAVGDYTPRLRPCHPIASVPLEAQEILWQR
jgi:starch phosphorylase